MKQKLLLAVSVFLLSLCMFGFSGQTVNAKTAPVKLVKKSVTLTVTKTNNGTLYGTQRIKVKTAKNIKIKKISYKSKNKKIAVISLGKVKAKAKGSTKIKITVKYKKKGKKKVYKKTLTMKVKVKVKDKRTKETTKNGNTTSVENYWYTKNGKTVVTGTTVSAAAPSKAKGKYLKTLNVGAIEDANGEMETDNNCVTADVYAAFGDNNHEYYTIYIKTNNSKGYLYADYKSNFRTKISEALNTDEYDTKILAVVFENNTKLYSGEELFRYVLEDPYSISVNYGGIYNLNYLDTSICENYEKMFEDAFSAGCISKMNFYLPTTFNTANATDMYGMFENMGRDTTNSTVTLPETFDTSKVEELGNIFSGLRTTTLNLPEKFVIAKFKEGTEYASSADVSEMFYASYITNINTTTTLDLRYCKECICFPSNATLKTHKAFVDSLNFSYLENTGLMLYKNSDIEFVNYVTNKILTEAKNLKELSFAYVEVALDSFTLDLKNYPQITDFANTFGWIDIKTLIIKNAIIADAEEMFTIFDCQVLDISTCTFTEDCNFEKMFDYCYKNDYQLTIYVKDAAMQKKIIEVYNQDNPDKPITESNVIIGSYK